MVRFIAIALLLLSLPRFTAAQTERKSPADRKDDLLRLFHQEFVALTPGTGAFGATFRMGSKEMAPETERPEHDVKMSAPFAIARYEVTQELYEAIVGVNPSRWKGPRNSVEMVSWDEATAFCKKVTDAMRQRKLLGADEVIRLPSEAEWEYACRAGTTGTYSFGDSPDALGDYAWYSANSKGNDPPVGRKKPNAWGLYDMHGYVSEWCQDDWMPHYKEAPADGGARKVQGAKQRVIRGGSFADKPEVCRSAARQPADVNQRSDTLGFRCVKAREAAK